MTQPRTFSPPDRFARVCLTTAVVTAIGAFWLWALAKPTAALGLASGAALGLLMMSAVVFVVERTIRPPEERPAQSWPYVVLHVGKFLVAAAVIYALLTWAPGSLAWFALGYGIPIAVIVLKALGAALNRRVGVD